MPQQPGVQGGAMPQQPGFQGGPMPQQPAVSGSPEPPAQGGATSNSNRAPFMPPGSNGTSYRQPQLQAPVPVQPAVPTPRVRYDRITSMPRHNTEGKVVRADRLPQAQTQVIFVCADDRGGRQTVTTDNAGRFRTTLAAGNWLIYTQDAAGRLQYQQKVCVETDKLTAPIALVSR